MYYCTEVHGGVVSGRQGLTTKKLGRAEGTEGTEGTQGTQGTQGRAGQGTTWWASYALSWV